MVDRPFPEVLKEYGDAYHPLGEVLGIRMDELIVRLTTASVVALYLKLLEAES